MRSGLEGRTAFVTGGAQGIGKAIAARLLADGARVWICDIDPEVRSTAAVLGSGSDCGSSSLDVSDERAFEEGFGEAVAALGAIDILVNNAGLSRPGSVWDVTAEEWDHVLAVNLRGVFFGCRIAGKHMRDRGFGRIINLGSLAGQRGGTVAGPHYSSSKAGVMTLTKVFAQELAPHGVTVNAIAPGLIAGANADSMPPERIEALSRAVPMARMGTGDDIAAAVAYLASSDGAYVTGTTIDVNGGVFMR